MDKGFQTDEVEQISTFCTKNGTAETRVVTGLDPYLY